MRYSRCSSKLLLCDDGSKLEQDTRISHIWLQISAAMLVGLDWHKSSSSSVRTGVIAQQFALWPPSFEQIQCVGLPVSIWWAPVVCLCSWSVPSFGHSQRQYLKLSCWTGALEIYSLSWARMSCSLWTLIWHVYRGTASSASYKLFYNSIDRRGNLQTRTTFLIVWVLIISLIVPVYWFSKQSMTKVFKAISADHYLHSCQAMDAKSRQLFDPCAMVCIGEHS